MGDPRGRRAPPAAPRRIFARKGERELYDAAHPLNLLWNALNAHVCDRTAQGWTAPRHARGQAPIFLAVARRKLRTPRDPTPQVDAAFRGAPLTSSPGPDGRLPDCPGSGPCRKACARGASPARMFVMPENLAERTPKAIWALRGRAAEIMRSFTGELVGPRVSVINVVVTGRPEPAGRDPAYPGLWQSWWWRSVNRSQRVLKPRR